MSTEDICVFQLISNSKERPCSYRKDVLSECSWGHGTGSGKLMMNTAWAPPSRSRQLLVLKCKDIMVNYTIA